MLKVEIRQGHTLNLLIKTNIDLTAFDIISQLHLADAEAETPSLVADLQAQAELDEATGNLTNIALSIPANVSISLEPSTSQYLFDVLLVATDSDEQIVLPSQAITVKKSYTREA